MRQIPSSDHIRLSEEQKDIVRYEWNRESRIRILAFAGTGKTRTLLECTRMRPNTRFLYIAFNKSVQEDANKKFDPHVHCRTLHSLAFSAAGFRYRHKIERGSWDYVQIAEALEMDTKGKKAIVKVKMVMQTVLNYLHSQHEVLMREHLATEFVTLLLGKGVREGDTLQNAFEKAGDLLKLMNSEKDDRVKMLHDGYLKLYQLQRPDWSRSYDCVMIDEAQDTSGCGVAIANMQKNVAITFVGDPHQQIYSFRGAVNAMDFIQMSHTMYLSQSFRFGSNISHIVNSLLHLKKSEEKSVIGTRQEDFVVTELPNGGNGIKYTFLARKNSSLFDHAFSLMSRKKCAFQGRIRSYNTSQIWSMYYLRIGDLSKVHDSFLKSFGRWLEFSTYMEEQNDGEYKGSFDLVRKYDRQLPGLLKSLVDHATAAERDNNYDVLFSTVHKAKGLEWDTVLLASDFFDDSEDRLKKNTDSKSEAEIEEEKKKKIMEEVNILYVALTRAIRVLVVPEDVQIICYGSKKGHAHPDVEVQPIKWPEELLLAAEQAEREHAAKIAMQHSSSQSSESKVFGSGSRAVSNRKWSNGLVRRAKRKPIIIDVDEISDDEVDDSSGSAPNNSSTSRESPKKKLRDSDDIVDLET